MRPDSHRYTRPCQNLSRGGRGIEESCTTGEDVRPRRRARGRPRGNHASSMARSRQRPRARDNEAREPTTASNDAQSTSGAPPREDAPCGAERCAAPCATRSNHRATHGLQKTHGWPERRRRSAGHHEDKCRLLQALKEQQLLPRRRRTRKRMIGEHRRDRTG